MFHMQERQLSLSSLLKKTPTIMPLGVFLVLKKLGSHSAVILLNFSEKKKKKKKSGVPTKHKKKSLHIYNIHMFRVNGTPELPYLPTALALIIVFC